MNIAAKFGLNIFIFCYKQLTNTLQMVNNSKDKNGSVKLIEFRSCC